jgi:vitamin B12 transporter
MKKHFFVLAAVIFSNQLMAQKDTSLLDEVIVTANKYPNKASLTGKVVTVINPEQLERSGSKDLSQILSEQAGVIISGANSNTGKDKSIYLRGGYISHTLITIDGIPVYDPSGIGGNFDLRNLAVSNIERIEILKGSQSTLYGSDALNGVINIITKKNTNKLCTGNAALSYGSNETYKTNIGFNGKSGIMDYNTSYSFHQTKGINETINKNNFPITDRDKFQQNSLQIGIGIRPSEMFYIQPFFRLSNIKGDIDQGAFTDELDYTYRQKSWQTGVRNELIIGKVKLYLLYNYNNINRTYIDDSVKSRNGYDIYSRGTYKGAEHFIDAYATIPFNKFVKLTTGADLRFSTTKQEYISLPAWGPPSKLDTNMNQKSLYAALTINTKNNWNAEFGSRVNFHSSYGKYFVFNFNPSYLINKKVKLFANLSSAYRTPSLYQLFSEYGNKSLKPEAGITTEGGVQYYSTNNKLTGRLVAFNRTLKDVIYFLYNPVTFTSLYINQDKQKDHGFEMEAVYKFKGNTALKIFYTYTTGEITTRISGKDTTYNNLLRRPKSSLGINCSTRIGKNFFVSGNIINTGKRQDAYYDNSTFSTAYVTLKNYLLCDIYTEYSFAKIKLKLFADLRNITNTKYTEISGFNTPGFNCYGGIRFSF